MFKCIQGEFRFFRNQNTYDARNPACYILPGATFILSINIDSVFNDLDFESLRKTQLFKQKLQPSYQNNPIFSKVAENPKLAGIDTKAKAIFYIDVGENKESVYSVSIFPLASYSQFTDQVSNQWKGSRDKSSTYESIQINGASSVAWNQDVVVFITSFTSFNKKKWFGKVFREKREKYFDVREELLPEFNSFHTDAAFWFDFDAYARNQVHATGKEGEIPKAVLAGNYLHGVLNFENGLIEAEAYPRFNQIVTGFLNKLFLSKLPDSDSNKFLSDMPGDVFEGMVSLDMAGVFQILLSSPELKVQARDSLASYGLMVEDFSQAFTGRSVLKSFPNDTTTKSSVVIGFELKDKSSFFKIIDIMTDLGKILPEEGGTYQMVHGGTIPFLPIHGTYADGKQRMLIKGNMVYFSLDKSIIEGLRLSAGDGLQNKDNKLESRNNIIYFHGTEMTEDIQKFTDQFGIEEYEIAASLDTIRLKFVLLDLNKQALKQIIKIN